MMFDAEVTSTAASAVVRLTGPRLWRRSQGHHPRLPPGRGRVPFVSEIANLSGKVIVSVVNMTGAGLRGRVNIASVSVNLVGQEIVPSADVSLILILVANLALKVEVGLVEKVGQYVGVGLTDKVVGNVVAPRVDSNAHVIAKTSRNIGSTSLAARSSVTWPS